MENYQELLQKYLGDVETFLTSLLLEEAKINASKLAEHDAEGVLKQLNKNDIVLFVRDEKAKMDFIAVLDEEWFGLLSSVMLGVEEKKFNEVTKDLLKKFSLEFCTTLKKKFDAEKVDYDFGSAEVYQVSQLESVMNHSSYFYCKLEVEGIADDNVRAAFIIGNPEAAIEKKADKEKPAKEEKQNKNTDKPAPDLDSEETGGKEEKQGDLEKVVSAKYIEFEDFDEPSANLKGSNGNSMDLLKDVEMDVSVELGRIELPLGKVMQLTKGSVIELEKLAGEPVDILVNGQKIAHGEVVVIDEHFGVRISNLITTRKRLANLS